MSEQGPDNNQTPVDDKHQKARPQFEVNWFLLKVKELETISFFVGIVVGVVLTLSTLSLITTRSIFDFSQSASTSSKQHIKLYNLQNNVPEILEGSHYKLKPEREYRIEVVNPDTYGEIVWKLIPTDFGEVDFNSGLVTPEKLFAIYKTPQVPNGSSGFIEICELEQSNLCRSLNLPEIKVVISQ
ncbi:hypothetical protein KFU94_01085 [Chloroflexi bacterium TSY]|nr:hypothetical protein [Chloroflexi bacterium TSY]